MSQNPLSRNPLPRDPLSMRHMSPNGVPHGRLSFDAPVGSAVVSPAVSIAGRIVGAGLLLGMAWIHWHLYKLGFSSIPTIGPAFKANAVLGVIAAIAVLITPTRWLGVTAGGAALLDAGTLGALAVSLSVGLFGFHESTDAPLLPATVIVEVFGTIELAWLAFAHRRPLLDALRRLRSGRGTV
jgi:hypothetical protein